MRLRHAKLLPRIKIKATHKDIKRVEPERLTIDFTLFVDGDYTVEHKELDSE